MPSKKEVENAAKRREEVEECMSSMLSDRAVAKKLAPKWGVTIRTIHYDCAAIRKRWMADAEFYDAGDEKRVARRHQAREMLLKIYHEAMDLGKLAACVSAVTRLMELDGIRDYASMKVDVVNHKTVKIEHLTQAERKERVAELIAKYSEAGNRVH